MQSGIPLYIAKNCTKILFGDNFTLCLENRSKLAKTF